MYVYKRILIPVQLNVPHQHILNKLKHEDAMSLNAPVCKSNIEDIDYLLRTIYYEVYYYELFTTNYLLQTIYYRVGIHT